MADTRLGEQEEWRLAITSGAHSARGFADVTVVVCQTSCAKGRDLVEHAPPAHAPDGLPTSLITKLPSRDEGSRRLGATMGVYEAEVPPVDARIPAMHWGGIEAETGRFTLVIDNLSPGSQVGDMVAGCSMEHAELAVLELVKLQARSWDAPAVLDKPWIADILRTEMLFETAAADEVDSAIDMRPPQARVRNTVPRTELPDARTVGCTVLLVRRPHARPRRLRSRAHRRPPTARCDPHTTTKGSSMTARSGACDQTLLGSADREER